VSADRDSIKAQRDRRVKRRGIKASQAASCNGFHRGRPRSMATGCAACDGVRLARSGREWGRVGFSNRGDRKRTVVLFSRVVHPELDDAFRVYRGCAAAPGTSAALPCAFFFFRARGRVPRFPYRGLDRPPGVRGILPECVTPSFETYRPSRWKMLSSL
jgi:hypothetical protein